jgi:uncharacterized membrane protein
MSGCSAEDLFAQVAVAFADPSAADNALDKLRRLQKEYLIDLEDAVVAVRGADGEVRLKQSVNLTGIGAASGGLWGGLWGSLVGLLFLNPLAGFAIGTMVGSRQDTATQHVGHLCARSQSAAREGSGGNFQCQRPRIAFLALP